MGNFLDTYHLPKLNKGEMSNLNQPITSNELEAVIKSSPINVSPGQDGYSTNYYQTFREGVMLRLIPQHRSRNGIAQFISLCYSHHDTQTT